MIINEKQKVNIVARAIIIHQGHLLVTTWKDSFSFLIGGRVDFAEAIEEAVVREVYEETKIKAKINRLVYFNENIFEFKGKQVHEFGWYYLMDVSHLTINIGEIQSNPDSENLTLQFIPLNKLDTIRLYPSFLVKYLPKDMEKNDEQAPRHIFSNDLPEPAIIKEMHQTFMRR